MLKSACFTTGRPAYRSLPTRRTLDIVPQMQHVFQFLAGTAPEGDAANHRLVDWVRPKLGLR